MKHRGVDINGNWVFGKGKNSYATGKEAIKLNIRTRLLSFKYNCFFDLEAGINWFDLGSASATNLQLLDLKIREVISTSYGVNKIISSDLNIDRNTRAVSVTYNVQLLDNTLLEDTAIIGNL